SDPRGRLHGGWAGMGGHPFFAGPVRDAGRGREVGPAGAGAPPRGAPRSAGTRAVLARPPPPALPPPQPTRVRYGVLGFVCSLSMITYLDRVCFGAAATSIITALSLTSEADFTWFWWAFAFSYAIFEVPTGWLGDVFGPRNTLIRIVLW